MKYDYWVESNIGRGIDYDGVYGVQCVDLVKHFVKNVLEFEPQSIGNAIEYYNKRNTSAYLKDNFKWIDNYAEFIPQKGDICVFTSKSGKGHISVATGEGTTSYFYSYDENYPSGKHEPMTKIKHSYKSFLGVHRPYNQENINTPDKKWEIWANGSTPETVFKDAQCKYKIGSLNPYEKAHCYLISCGNYAVVYNINGGYKAGYVKYAGGVNEDVENWRDWNNGSTSETVYADTQCEQEIGTIFPHESAWCYDFINGVYLVCYRAGNDDTKFGFVKYHG